MARDFDIEITLTVNGETISRRIEPRLSLADFLRHELGLTATKVGCEHGVCGACTVRIDGDIARSCLTLAVQVAGQSIETLEGLNGKGTIGKLQQTFAARNAAQCGFCTAGMLITAAETIERHPQADRQTIRDNLSGNYCRCTGYQAIVNAVEDVAREDADD